MTLRLSLLFATFLSLPFAIRKILWVAPGPLFKEYSDVSIYLFEIFLIGYVLLSLLEHKNKIKSIYKRVFLVEHLLILVLLALSSIIAAAFENTYYSLYLFSRWLFYSSFAYFLYLDLIAFVPRGTIVATLNKYCSTRNISFWKKFKVLFHAEHSYKRQESENCSTRNNVAILFFIPLLLQAILVLIQVLSQKSVGLIFLGEPVLNTSIAGVATIIIHGKEYLRGYGTFLHPNIAAFFFFVYGIAYLFLRIVPRGTISQSVCQRDCSTRNTILWKKWEKLFHEEHFLSHSVQARVLRGTSFLFISTILVGFILTFSKSILGISFLLLIIFTFLTNCSTGNISKRVFFWKLFHVEQSGMSKEVKNVLRGTIFSLLIILGALFILKTEWPAFINQSILERKLQYLSIPVDNFSGLLVGEGLGNYTKALAEKSPGLFSWQVQPIHNVFILLMVELGLLPVLGITLYMWLKYQKNLFFSLKNLVLSQKVAVILGGGVAALLAVDHYAWDIEQGQFLFVFLTTIIIFLFQSPLPDTQSS